MGRDSPNIWGQPAHLYMVVLGWHTLLYGASYPSTFVPGSELVVYPCLVSPESWFEFTPHHAGYPALGAYVPITEFGSRFENGKLVKSEPERDLTYLRGQYWDPMEFSGGGMAPLSVWLCQASSLLGFGVSRGRPSASSRHPNPRLQLLINRFRMWVWHLYEIPQIKHSGLYPACGSNSKIVKSPFIQQMIFVVVLDWVSCIPFWPWSDYVAEASPELLFLLHPSPKC